MAKKELYSTELGGDGGKLAIGAEAGMFELKFLFPVLKASEPLRKKLKELVPGEKFDGYVDLLIDAGLKALGIESKVEAETQPEAAPTPEVQA